MMIPRLGQFGHTFKRGIVKTVEQRCHAPNPKTADAMYKAAYIIGIPLYIALAWYYRKCEKEHPEPPERIPYPYMGIMNKPFPWGDGKTPLFCMLKQKLYGKEGH